MSKPWTTDFNAKYRLTGLEVSIGLLKFDAEALRGHIRTCDAAGYACGSERAQLAAVEAEAARRERILMTGRELDVAIKAMTSAEVAEMLIAAKTTAPDFSLLENLEADVARHAARRAAA